MEEPSDPAAPDQPLGLPPAVQIRQGMSLPHWTLAGAIYHVVFRLADSLPEFRVREFEEERDGLLSRADLAQCERERLRYLVSRRAQQFLDTGAGCCILADPANAEIVRDTMSHFDEVQYRLHAYCIMPNHVHAVLEPQPGHKLENVLQGWKSVSAHRINKARIQSGVIWQKESYDHIIRSEDAYLRVVEYVISNPGSAGLREWPWVYRATTASE